MMMPPLTWLSHVSLLTINPPSCTQVTFFTFTNPVSVSTSTSTNCTPPAPVDERPSTHCPETMRGFTPSFLQAAFQFSPRASVTPLVFCNSVSAFVQVSKIAGETDAQVVLPPLPPEEGKFVSPTLTWICSGLRPKTSA